MSVPDRTPVRQSLLRPQLFFGGERELVLLSGMFCLMAAYAISLDWLIVMPIACFGLAMAVLPRMAKHDPQLSKVYIRHMNRRTYYPASPHFTASEPQARKHQ
jgi:type IV secretory pathway TrbD component